MKKFTIVSLVLGASAVTAAVTVVGMGASFMLGAYVMLNVVETKPKQAETIRKGYTDTLRVVSDTIPSTITTEQDA